MFLYKVAFCIELNEYSFTTYKQTKLTAAYEALSKHGFKFTTYEEK